jgi:GAF domain
MRLLALDRSFDPRRIFGRGTIRPATQVLTARNARTLGLSCSQFVHAFAAGIADHSIKGRMTGDFMQSFIRVVELWIPNEARTALEFGGGLYDDEMLEFREISELALFGQGEGLPGKAWAARRPVILTELSDPDFRRADEAKLLGLSCGVGIPVVAGDRIVAVIGLFCGNDKTESAGAIELWHNDAERLHELVLVDGYYGSAGGLEFNSRHITFPRGYGLPGRAWKADGPVMIKDIEETPQFLRAKEAAEVGINFGFAIPYLTSASETWVLSFLSARKTPIAKRLEIWKPDASADALVFQSGYCSRGTDLAAAFAARAIHRGEGCIGRAWASGLPAVSDELRGAASIAEKAAVDAGLHRMVVLPVFRGDQLQAEIVWYL